MQPDFVRRIQQFDYTSTSDIFKMLFRFQTDDEKQRRRKYPRGCSGEIHVEKRKETKGNNRKALNNRFDTKNFAMILMPRNRFTENVNAQMLFLFSFDRKKHVYDVNLVFYNFYCIQVF